jgi:hypothetical protein
MFSNAKVGDKVWDFTYGWGKIYNIDLNSDYPIKVERLNEMDESYTFDGKLGDEEAPTLFWDEIKYEIPTKPKRMVTKTVEVWETVYNLEPNPPGSRCFHESLEHCKRFRSKINDLIAYVKLTGTYEVEED